MKLSKKSWHYKVNMWHTYRVPKNLCGYFWRTVWYTITLPITLVFFIPLGIAKIVVDEPWEEFVDEYPNAFLVNLLAGTSYCMVMMWFHLHPKVGDPWVIVWVFGLVGWGILLIVGIEKLIRIIKGKKSKKEKRPNIFVEYMKAKKNKYCPKIEWEE